mmetsp:Transcript_28541/g.41680  ORF Transcript_28541/g.41680 Transcript_28541/m.41680 type:complete len:364 (-) Transcript_28541:406-1497(-)
MKGPTSAARNNMMSSIMCYTILFSMAISITNAFVMKPSITNNKINIPSIGSSSSSNSKLFVTNEETGSKITTTTTLKSEGTVSEEWELDCYSRPVTVDNKKLWEVLITDSNGVMRVCEALPSNKVNSRELRRVVEETIEESDVKPTMIRFFRGAMFNMITIALSEVEVVAKPSRRTFALTSWIEERNRDVYPKMEGYRPAMARAGMGPSFLDISIPQRLPDALRGEKYAFVSLPLAEFREGGSINSSNVGVGRLCPVDPTLPADAFVQGIVMLTPRAKALSSWLAGTEVAGFTCDLRKRTLAMDTDIDTKYLIAKLNDVQRAEGAVFEEGKDNLGGLHFVSVQVDEDDDPAGFWLLRTFPAGL